MQKKHLTEIQQSSLIKERKLSVNKEQDEL